MTVLWSYLQYYGAGSHLFFFCNNLSYYTKILYNFRKLFYGIQITRIIQKKNEVANKYHPPLHWYQV
nr:MAG TPA: hypothetical protein [Caudoviricetes sp.]